MKKLFFLTLIALSAEGLVFGVFGAGPASRLVTSPVFTSPGSAVSDQFATELRGTAHMEAECEGWDADMGGCDTSYTVDYCPEDFDVFDEDGCTFCEYETHKVTEVRECDGGNINNTNYCTAVFDQLTGCVVYN